MSSHSCLPENASAPLCTVLEFSILWNIFFLFPDDLLAKYSEFYFNLAGVSDFTVKRIYFVFPQFIMSWSLFEF